MREIISAFNLFYRFLLDSGVKEDYIIRIQLDDSFLISKARRYDIKGNAI